MNRFKRAALGTTAAALLVAGGLGIGRPQSAWAGSDGQQLSLRDINGNAYYGDVTGYDQNCNFTSLNFNWPTYYQDLSGYWWQDWNGTVNGKQCSTGGMWFMGWADSAHQNLVFGQSLINYGTGPVHSQTGNWWSCKMDGVVYPVGYTDVYCQTGYRTE
jgi:hypothetical protein